MVVKSEWRKQELTNDGSPGRAEWRSSVRATANYGIDVRHSVFRAWSSRRSLHAARSYGQLHPPSLTIVHPSASPMSHTIIEMPSSTSVSGASISCSNILGTDDSLGQVLGHPSDV
jgi:hypothetical protein